MKKITILLLVLIATLVSITACSGSSTSTAGQLDDKTWLSPGKIQISNYSPGSNVVHKLEIHCGNNFETKYTIYYRIPDYVENGFTTAPDNVRDWINIPEANPALVPGETKEIPITLNLPKDAQTPDRWEFWVGIKEINKSMLNTELCSRWLITMRR